MKLFLILVTFLFLGLKNLWAYETLRTGDILLQPLDCWSCTLIEAQEKTKYSHMGVVLKIDGKLMVAEAYKEVRLVSLEKFLEKTEKGQKVKARRLEYFFYIFENFAKNLNEHYKAFHKLPYDPKFLWDNEINGREALYCSEFVYKLFKRVLPMYDTHPKEMLFDINPAFWDRYFHNETPRGELGISPGDFARSQDFYDIFEIE